MVHEHSQQRGSSLLLILGAMAAGGPAILFQVLNISGAYHLGEVSPQLSALVNGVAIMGAAFILSWAAEAAQKDVSAALAIAVLALIALLPEYSVEAYLAWDAGANPGDPLRVGRLAANVTGANRLLIGLGWSTVAIAFWLRVRRNMNLPAKLSREIGLLAIATALSFSIFFFNGVAFVLGLVMILVYASYLVLSSLAKPEEPDLAGPSQTIGNLPRTWRRTVVVLLLLFAAGVILSSVEPFVHGLVDTGEALGISDFLLIQWLAPLASESPEMVVALLYTARANPAAGITVLVSAQVNQLTVLIGSMPMIFSISAGGVHSIHLQHTQVLEFLLTSALSLFAVVLIARRRLSIVSALTLLAVFTAQIITHVVFESDHARLETSLLVFSLLLIGGAVALILRDLARLWLLLRYIKRVIEELAGALARKQPHALPKGGGSHG
ncbi:MAG: hypothetical protein HY532_00960 [Chloroflexi bacterium]|nr:hypothetical protein [Chloroflexota bacterium]